MLMSSVLNLNLDLTPILEDFISKYGYIALVFYLFGFLTGGLIIVCLFKNPEKLKKSLSYLFIIPAKFFVIARKIFITLDFEGRINDFIKGLESVIYGYEPVGIKIKWTTSKGAEQSFFDDNDLVIVVRDSGVKDKNFVNASMIAIAKTVLLKTKRYLSGLQAESVDLFIGKKLFEKEKPQVMDYFFAEFFDKRVTGQSAIEELVNRYHIIDRAGLFFPIFIQELNFLGEKVFYRSKKEEIIKEVNELVEFLKLYAEREIGTTETSLIHQGRYCRCAIVIIGKYFNISEGKIDMYREYIKKLLAQKIENFYIINPETKINLEFVNSVLSSFSEEELQVYRTLTYKAFVNIGKEDYYLMNTHLTVLRSNDVVRYFDSNYEEDYIEKPERINLEANEEK